MLEASMHIDTKRYWVLYLPTLVKHLVYCVKSSGDYSIQLGNSFGFKSYHPFERRATIRQCQCSGHSSIKPEKIEETRYLALDVHLFPVSFPLHIENQPWEKRNFEPQTFKTFNAQPAGSERGLYASNDTRRPSAAADSVFLPRPSAPSPYPSAWHNPTNSDAVSSQKSSPAAHSLSNPALNSSGHAPHEAILGPEHYFTVFHAFTDCPSIDPVSVTVSERTYATPRKAYAQMRAHKFRSATEADLLITALRTFRAKAKAAVLNSLACCLYLEDDPQQRHLLQYLLGGFSLLESRSTDSEVLLTPWNSHGNNPAAMSSIYSRPDLNTVEDDLRPLVFVLFQVQEIRGDKLPRKSLLYRREDKDAADEMETPRIKIRMPRISALARKARADARSLQDPEIARRLYLDMNTFFRRSMNPWNRGLAQEYPRPPMSAYRLPLTLAQWHAKRVRRNAMTLPGVEPGPSAQDVVDNRGNAWKFGFTGHLNPILQPLFNQDLDLRDRQHLQPTSEDEPWE
ncbi:hypothetical protein C8R47DRAFT_1267561 [Mycena vitilis]|nr:hypothetical protein C8R47DRAFT_1267561 [Mycena vitilis]